MGLFLAVLDWNFEPTIDNGLKEANLAYVASDVLRLIACLAPTEALDSSFVSELRSGSLPGIDVIFPSIELPWGEI